MNELTSAAGIAAIAAAAIALLTLVWVVLIARRLRGLRADQRLVLGAGEQDLIAHAADLQRQFEALHAYVVDVATKLDGRLGAAETRLDGALSHRAIVRYDAYNEMSGRQSTSIALLDEHYSGVVLSSIHHRDQARLYVKQVVAGAAAVPLSPEEQEAMRAALAGELLDVPATER